MKGFKLFCLSAVSALLCVGAGFHETRYDKAERCYGCIKIVDAGEDFCVKIVDAAADMDVRLNESPFCGVGEWYFVTAGEDFCVKIVDAGEDFSVKFAPFGCVNRPKKGR